MALITDPDLLTQSTAPSSGTEDGEVYIDTSAKTIELMVFGNLSADGATLKAIYSFLKEEWRSDADLIKFDFPMTPITDESMQIGVSSRNNGWVWFNDGTRNLIRTGGWQEVDASGGVEREYAGVITLGSLESGTQVYHQQASGGSAVDFTYDGALNEAIQVYGDASNGNFDRRSYLKLFARNQADTFASSTLSDIGVSTMTYQVYRFPLATATDLKINTVDTDIDANSDETQDVAPYDGMTVTYYGSAQSKAMGSSNYNFGVVVDANGGTALQVYNFLQWLIRQDRDIDTGAGTLNGLIADQLAYFVGETLYTRAVTNPAGGGTGVFIEDIAAGSINSVVYVDNTGAERQFPFTAALTPNFSDTLQTDASARYWIFFTNDDAGDNAGYDFNTVNAILVRTATSFATTNRARTSNVATITVGSAHGFEVGDMVEVVSVGGTGYNGYHVLTAVTSTTLSYASTGSNETSTGDTGGTVYRSMGGLVDGAASVSLTYDFDTNVQRGTGSDGEDAPITAVAIGLSGAQYVLTTGTLTRSTANSISLVAPVERNYSNP